ncbi:MAG: rhodanese-like domain-containing protein [Bacteroidetes bacterium]|jgi:rhodanese-related sulfurtransferase|nr:rhodanese-like domain-containing protein [Bacteroidota bacterium]
MEAKEFFEHKLSFEVDADDVMEELQKGADLVIVDTRKTEAYEQEHIEGAISFPHREMNEKSVQKLDRNKTYITYCINPGCNASTKGAYKLSKLGFTVKEMLGGLDWWKEEGFPTIGDKANAPQPEDVSCNC